MSTIDDGFESATGEFVACRECGAVVMNDLKFRHYYWHEGYDEWVRRVAEAQS